MLRRFIIFLSVILTFTACNLFGGPKKPKNLISKDNMVNILIDAKLLATASTVNKNIMESHGLVISDYVFKKHKIDSLQFALSNEYYAYKIKDYEDIYTRVLDSLEKLKVVLKDLEIKEKRENEKNEKDSLNSLKVKDSLKHVFNKDSLKEILIKRKGKIDEGVLINPVSDKKTQSQK